MHQSTELKICEAKTVSTERRTRQIQNHSQRLQYLFFNNNLTREKIGKSIEFNTTKPQNPINIYRTFHPIAAEYTFFSNVYGT